MNDKPLQEESLNCTSISVAAVAILPKKKKKKNEGEKMRNSVGIVPGTANHWSAEITLARFRERWCHP